MGVDEEGEVIEAVMDAPQSLGAIVSLFVLEEELTGLGRCFSESRIPP
jgi:hypothetical protein